MDDSENAFTAHPRAIFVPDPAVIHHSRLVKVDATTVDLASKGDLIWVEVFPAGFPSYFMG